MSKRLNLTQHKSAPEQGCTEVADREELEKLLTFEELPSRDEIIWRASKLAELAHGYGATEAMIGGAPWLMGPLEKALMDCDIKPVYAFSTREAAEETLSDGSVRKVSKFIHKGFVR